MSQTQTYADPRVPLINDELKKYAVAIVPVDPIEGDMPRGVPVFQVWLEVARKGKAHQDAPPCSRAARLTLLRDHGSRGAGRAAVGA